MRTTINIATPILEELKSIQKNEGGTLGESESRPIPRECVPGPGPPHDFHEGLLE